MNQKEEIKRLARPYARLIRWSDEDECFVGSLPELDGDCTHGSTVEEVARNLDECAELYVEDCLTDGTPLPEPRAAVIVPGKSRTWANENAIAQLRQSRGVTQKDFARLLGVSLSTLINGKVVSGGLVVLLPAFWSLSASIPNFFKPDKPGTPFPYKKKYEKR